MPTWDESRNNLDNVGREIPTLGFAPYPFKDKIPYVGLDAFPFKDKIPTWGFALSFKVNMLNPTLGFAPYPFKDKIPYVGLDAFPFKDNSRASRSPIVPTALSILLKTKNLLKDKCQNFYSLGLLI